MSGLQGIYILTSRMQTQLQQMDATAVNVANTNTPGYKTQEVDFATVLGGHNSHPAGKFVLERGFRNNLSQGVINQTGNPLDVAIVGQGFFAIQKPDGTPPVYTRDGSFTVSADGTLINQRGESVLNRGNAEIQIPTGATINVGPSGDVIANGNQVIDQIGVFRPPENAAFIRVGGNQFRLAQGGAAAPVERPQVVGGAVEGANVDPVLETVRLNEVSQAYQGAARLMSRLEELQERAIRELPRSDR